MTTKNSSERVTVNKLENQIACIKYTLFCLNIITWILAAGLFAVSIWLRVEPGFEDWVSKLELHKYYIGIYLLMFVGLVMLGISFLGCAAALTEIYSLLIIFIGTQVFEFILGITGSAVLMDYSTVGSRIQPLMREVMFRLLTQARYDWAQETLSMIQETIGCCGADGPNDYISMKQPLPNECRDTVTGNAYFHGCVDELTWYMEGKSIWLSCIALFLCFICVLNAVLAGILLEALRKEEREATVPHFSPEKRFN